MTIGHSSVPTQVLQLADLNTGQIRALDKEKTIVIIPGACSHTPSPAEPIRDAGDTLLLDLHKRGLFNGADVLGRVGEEVYARGFGPANVEAGAAFTPDTPADGASMAKTLTAAAVLMLHDEGRLRLDDPVRRHFPEYPHTTTRVRHLITHSAGLPEYEFFDQFVPQDEIRTTLGFLSILRERAVEPACEPGTRFSYNSFGFDVAALIVERLTG